MKQAKIIPFLIITLLAQCSLIGLRLSNVIRWNWLLVFFPVWFPVAVVGIFPLSVLYKLAMLEVTHQVRRKQTEAASTQQIDALAQEYGLQRKPGESNTELKSRIAYIKQIQRRERQNGKE